MSSTIWRLVLSQLKPVDVASRGAELTTLIHDKSWFEGPGWLRESPSKWPCSSINFASVKVGQIAADANAPPTSADELLAKFSDLNVLLRFLVRLCRWSRLRLKRPSTVPVLSPITAKDFNGAFYACVILSQRHHFAPELVKLQTKGHLSHQSPLKGLHVFVDPMGIMRVGGRL